MNLTTGSDLQRFGEVMGFLMTGGMMIAATAYLWKRWRKKRSSENRGNAVRTGSSVPDHSRRINGENLAGIPRHPAAIRADSAPHVRQLRTPQDEAPRRPAGGFRQAEPAGQMRKGSRKCQLVSGMSPTTFPRVNRGLYYQKKEAVERLFASSVPDHRKSGWDTSPPCCYPRRFRPSYALYFQG